MAILSVDAISPLCIVYRLPPIPIFCLPVRSPFCSSNRLLPIPVLLYPENCALAFCNVYILFPIPILLPFPVMLPPLPKEYTVVPIPTLVFDDMVPPLGK